MKKRIFFLLIFSLFCVSSSAESWFPQARSYANELEERFGVQILIGEECLDVLETDVFSIGDTAQSSSPFLQASGFRDPFSELQILESALSRYPVEIFQYIRRDEAPLGLRFLIADRIIDSDPALHSAGYSLLEDSFYTIVLSRALFGESTVHHEMWHVMEFAISSACPDAFSSWEALNPPGFEYSLDYSVVSSGFDPLFFACEYGTVNTLEDRATIAEAVFSDHRNDWFSERLPLKRKLEAMNLALRDTLIIQYNVK